MSDDIDLDFIAAALPAWSTCCCSWKTGPATGSC